MSKKKLVAGLLASASVLGICLSGGTALAAEVQKEDTTVGIGFGEHVNPPGGELQIAWLPKSFDFGSGHTPDAVNAVDYTAKGAAKKYVVVSDARAESNADKWILTAKLSDLKDGANTLSGATLKFNTTLMGYSGDKAPEDPTSVIPAGTRTAVVPATASLTPGAAATTVMNDDGAGTTSFKGKSAVEMSDIKLNVLGGKALDNKTYTGTVTWSLDDTL
ncbi:WxL domain-containing protein [Enterococcus sp. AZ196]|uniref:WxL domain-containing protein n=1 Tax=Enterococcus sp. AZ196 TaxID=2774659 RepID=UPI003D2CAB9E